MVRAVPLALQVFLERGAGLERQEKRAHQALQVLKGELAFQAHPVCQGSLESEVYQDCQACQD